MPRKRTKEINTKQIKEESEYNINNLLLSIPKEANYVVLDYSWFYDYYKLLFLVSKKSTLKYSPEEKTKNMIELISISEDVAVVIKVKIIKTNIKEELFSYLNHDIPFTKYQNNLLLLVFEPESITIKSYYDNSTSTVELNNNKFFTISNFNKSIEKEKETDNEEIFYDSDNYEELDNDSCDEQELDIINKTIVSNGKYNFSSIIQEKFTITDMKNFTTLNDNIIKNVICFMSIEFDNLKNIIKKLGNTEINIKLLGNKMIMETHTAKYNKNVICEFSVINQNPKYFKKSISFFINSKSFTKLKTLTSNFHIVPGTDKKIFKRVEIKVVVDDSSERPIYGLTLSPGNLNNNTKINDGFDIYNSVLFYMKQTTK